MVRKLNSLQPSGYESLEAFLQAGRTLVPTELAGEEAVKEALAALSKRWNR